MALSRSEQMARIKGKNTTPERKLRSALWRAGLRYRLHTRTPVGKPDVVFATKRVAVFIDGCFWHGCPDHYVRPRSHEFFWRQKLRENIERDRRQTLELESLGWRVVRIWEHEAIEATAHMVSRVQSALITPHWKPQMDWRVILVESVDEATKWERRSLVPLRAEQPLRQTVGRRVTAKWQRTGVALELSNE
ncbi:very short patch repair endonuclease [Myxococcus sp. SDU36]|uniref:very short patch repair endonuclease n=1 Tax=Myxococcus sp. SDU36 TaxID=2831967 RepID=UPI0025429D1D|nr:very short patch repair endonuclease [Myxococcus sp. SDU36]WIG99358.1 very short patch repair endonuclease [Myxococcus sp. SDU36]